VAAERTTRRRLALAIFLLLTGIYGLSAGGHTYSSDEEGMFQTTRSLVERRAAEAGREHKAAADA